MKHFYGVALILLLLCHTQLDLAACAQSIGSPLDSLQSDAATHHPLTAHAGCCTLALSDHTNIQQPMQEPNGEPLLMPTPVPAHSSPYLIDPPPRCSSI